MKFTAIQIAQILGGTIEGNANTEVWDISKIEEGKPGSITFLANPLYTNYIYDTSASVVIVKNDFKPEKAITATLIRVDDPYLAFAKILKMVEDFLKKKRNGIASTAVIHESVQFEDLNDVWIGDYVVIEEGVSIGKGVYVFPHAYIGYKSSVGSFSVLHSGVKLYHEIVVGNQCILHSGVVIGSDGFGYAPGSDGSYLKIPQLGNVIIEDHVEIGANTVIDRGTMGSTIVKQGAKIDNLVHLGHNSKVGQHSAIAAQVGVSGSSKVGDHCMIGGQVGLSGHISVGNNVKIAAQSGIAGNIPENMSIMGSPAFEVSKYKRAFILFKNIEQMENRIRILEKNKKK